MVISPKLRKNYKFSSVLTHSQPINLVYIHIIIIFSAIYSYDTYFDSIGFRQETASNDGDSPIPVTWTHLSSSRGWDTYAAMRSWKLG